MLPTSNITTESGCKELLKESLKSGSVGGIFNLAAQLSDAILLNQNVTKFSECLAPKALATQYMDELSREMCPDLHYLVVFSSAACGMGNAGQSNYGMANSVMERIIEKRHKDGLPAKAIQWGAIGDVGIAYDLFVKDKNVNQSDVKVGGTIPQSILSCLETLDILVTSSDPILLSMVLAEKKFEDNSELSTMEKIMRILNVRNVKLIPPATTLTDLGMTSLVTIEIKQLLEREQQVFIETDDMRYLTVSKLVELVETKKNWTSEKWMVETKSVGHSLDFMFSIAKESLLAENMPIDRITKLNDENGEKCILLIPGIFGLITTPCRRIASGLKVPTFFLNPGDTGALESVKEVAEYIFEVS